MRSIAIYAGAGIALVASCGLAVAQGHGRGGGAVHAPGGGGIRAPGGGGAVRSAPSGMSRGEFHAPRAHRAERAPRMERNYRSETRRAQSRTLDRSRQQARRDLRQGNEARRAGREELNRKAAERGRGRDETANMSQRVSERHNEMQTARTQLSSENKERLRKAFNFDRARLHNVNFDHRVGHRIPRRIHLFPISTAVFAFFPYYRDYSYFVVDDDICIVDPRTYVVVDVIDRGYWSGPGRQQVAGLHLSAQEITVVRDSLPADFPDAGLRLRLALGAEIPQDADLHEFAPLVLDRVPQLQGYRFLVTGDQIVIVQRGDRSIALVIDRA